MADEPAVGAEADRLLGTTLSGRYRIDRLRSKGDGWVLYAGEHVHMHKTIAIKVLDASISAPSAIARFEREAIAGAHIDHPNVAAAKDFGRLDDGSHFVVLEDAGGRTLADEIAAGPVPIDRTLRIARQIALALDAAHAIGIVHRALAPAHVRLVERGTDADVVKVCEFGWAKLPPELASRHTSDSMRMKDLLAPPVGPAPASDVYAAPETVAEFGRGATDARESLVDARSDLYSLGIVVHELLTKRVPQGGASFAAELPSAPALAHLLDSLVARDKAERPASAAAFVEALDAATLDEVRPKSFAGVPERALSSPLPEATAPTMLGNAAIAAASSPALVAKAQPAHVPFALPRPIRWLIGGGVAIVAIVLGAIAVRSPTAGSPQASSGGVVAARAGQEGSPSEPTPSTASAPRTIPDDARETWAALTKEHSVGRFKDAVSTLERLLEEDPKAASDKNVRKLVVDLAQRIMMVEGPEPDRMFEMLTDKMGTTGIDILYELETTRGGSRAAARASLLLEDADVRDRGTPAMRIAWDLRHARSCEKKADLLARAKGDGDVRTFGQLQLVNRSCSRRSDECCLKDDPRLGEALDAIKERMQ